MGIRDRCTYAATGYDCDGNCLNDADGDGTCDEFEVAGVKKEPSSLIKSPRVKESPIHFECKYYSTLRLPGNGDMGSVNIIIGRVIGIHISDDALTSQGLIDVIKLRPIARLGYYDYTSVESIFEMIIPGNNEKARLGMRGRQI